MLDAILKHKNNTEIVSKNTEAKIDFVRMYVPKLEALLEYCRYVLPLLLYSTYIYVPLPLLCLSSVSPLSLLSPACMHAYMRVWWVSLETASEEAMESMLKGTEEKFEMIWDINDKKIQLRCSEVQQKIEVKYAHVNVHDTCTFRTQNKI